MRASKIEELDLAHRDGFRQFVDIEAAAEGDDPCRHVLLAKRNRPPLETLACKRKNVALVRAREEEYKCFVTAKQALHLFGGRRLRVCECSIVREVLVDLCSNRVKPPFRLGHLPAQAVDPRPLVPTLRIRKRI